MIKLFVGDSMDIMNEIKVSLEQNPELTQGVRGNIYELSLIFHEKLPDVNLSNYAKKLETMKIIRLSKFIKPGIVSMYDCKSNIIYFNSSEVSKGYDMKHVLMFELINVIASNGEYSGFDVDDKYKVLNIGYTEMLANYLVGNDSEVSLYAPEASTVNMLSIMIGIDVFYQAYFTNNFEVLAAKMIEMGV